MLTHWDYLAFWCQNIKMKNLFLCLVLVSTIKCHIIEEKECPVEEWYYENGLERRICHY
tara:strand:+ start:815 stop:991 length:177 start_codon:yes stop_codon:yes gene_type:complete